MKVTVILECNVTENIEIEVKDLEELKTILKDGELWDTIAEQDAKTEEVCGEVLFTVFEVDGKEYSEEELKGELDNVEESSLSDSD